MSDHSWTAPGAGGTPDSSHPGPPPAPGGPPGPPPATGPLGAAPGQPGGPGPTPWDRVDLQPGIVPLRPLGLGDIYSGVMRLVRGNPGATVGMALLVALAVTLPLTALSALLTAVLAPEYSMSDTSVGASVADLTTNLPSLGQLVIGLLLPLFMAWVTRQAVLGRKVGMGETWHGTKDRVLPGLGALILTSLVFLGVLVLGGGAFAGVVAAAMAVGDGAGIALGIIAGAVVVLVLLAASLFFWTRFAFVLPSLTLERIGPVAAITRSWGLTRGRRFWPVLGIRFLTSLLTGFIGLVLACPLGVVVALAQLSLAGSGNAAYVVTALANGFVIIVTAALTTPLVAGVDALLYLGQRIEQEGHDIELLREAGVAPAGGHPRG